MSNQEREPDSLVLKVEHLAEKFVEMERRLDRLSEQFNNWLELQHLQDDLEQLHRQLDENSASPETPVDVANQKTEVAARVDEIQPQPSQVQPYEYQLVFDRSGSRAVLMEALEKAQSRLIIVCP